MLNTPTARADQHQISCRAEFSANPVDYEVLTGQFHASTANHRVFFVFVGRRDFHGEIFYGQSWFLVMLLNQDLC